jgi:DNA polymerase III alpha subunit
MEFEKSNRISNLITEKTISKSLEENEEFKDMVDSDEILEKIVNLAIKIEGTIRQT